jgi:multiple sugar transport system permease protein
MTNIATRRSPVLRRWLWAILLWAVGLVFLVPFAWMALTSLKRSIDVFGAPFSLLPHPVHWANYATVWSGPHPLVRYMANSAVVATARMAGDVVTASMAGYAFARLRFRGRDKIFFCYLATALVPTQLLLVPRFMYFRELGIYDTLWALILPGMFTVFGTFLMRQYFHGIPGELAESARLDGAGEWRIFWRIYLPLARPAVAALAILAFVLSWNDYETPLVLISSEAHYTVPIGLTNFADEQGGLSPGLAMAGAVSSVVPIVIVFVIMQRRFIQALTHSGLK